MCDQSENQMTVSGSAFPFDSRGDTSCPRDRGQIAFEEAMKVLDYEPGLLSKTVRDLATDVVEARLRNHLKAM